MKQSTIALALLPLLFTPVTKARTPEMPVLENRAAQGDITAPGGARRLTGDQTAALRDSLSDKPAKNIILLIRRTGDCGLIYITVVRCFRSLPAHWHIAVSKQS